MKYTQQRHDNYIFLRKRWQCQSQGPYFCVNVTWRSFLYMEEACFPVCTCLNDWTDACRAQCCGRMCQFLDPRSRPWQRDAPRGWPPSGGGHQICAPGSCHTLARWGSEPEGCRGRMYPPETVNAGRERAHWYREHVCSGLKRPPCQPLFISHAIPYRHGWMY